MPNDAPSYELVAEDPPNVVRNPLTVNLLLAMEAPGKWMRISTYAARNTAHTIASDLRRGGRADGGRKAPPGRWEFRTGEVDGRYGVWAKFLGPDA